MDLQLHRNLPSRKQSLRLYKRDFRVYKIGLGSLVSIKYHDLFGFALTDQELTKWTIGSLSSYKPANKSEVLFKDGFYFLRGNKGAVLKRVLRKKFSSKKMGIAKKAALVLGRIPTIKMVGVTGSLAMRNANEESDIDLIVVTANGTLWVTRIITYLLLKFSGFDLRKPRDKNEKDKLCLNMWIDECDLVIDKQNIYTAHEIAQIIPLKNKDKTYERFLFENSWVSKYWPSAVKIKKIKGSLGRKNSIFRLFEPLARGLQFAYMSGKLTCETVTATRAFFHPFDWGEKIINELGNSS